MWFLTHSKSDKIIFIKKEKTTIGRSECDILIIDDLSLSRTHAVLLLVGDNLTIKDPGSKYGTFLNDRRAPDEKLGAEGTPINNGDRVTFGKLGNEWEVHHFVQKTAFSMVDHGSKKRLEKILKKFGVQCSDTLDETCTHLTMSSKVIVSEKLLRALSSCTPVVTTSYWLAVQESFNNDQVMPKFLDYVPTIEEDAFVTPGIVSLALNDERKKLFAGKHFYFFSTAAMEAYEVVIKNAGGKCSSFLKVKTPIRDCIAKHSIIIQPRDGGGTQSQNEDTVSKIKNALSAKNRRMVPLTEVGLAVLYCSIDRFCNPDFCPTTLFEPSNSGQLKIATSKVLANDTEQSNSTEGFAVPTTSRGRGRPKKIIPAETTPKRAPQRIVATIDLDESEDDTIEKNKENIVTQSSISNIVIPESAELNQPSEVLQDDISMAQTIEDVEFPETARSSIDDPYISSIHQTPANPEFDTEDIFKKPQSEEISHRSTRSNQSSAPVCTLDLFNFTNVSSNASKRSQRKRKNSDDSNENPEQNPKPLELPTAKRNKQTKVINEKQKEQEEAQPPKPSRKRPQQVALDGDLFNFNIAAPPKKSKPSEVQSRKQNDGSTGVIALSKSLEAPPPKNLTTIYNYSDDSCDSGVWLSKKMLSVKLEDCTDGVKEEFSEIDPSIDTQDIQPGQIGTLFSVLEQSSNSSSSSSSTVSKRKQFVKKQNYKQQISRVTMKIMNVEDTHTRLDDF